MNSKDLIANLETKEKSEVILEKVFEYAEQDDVNIEVLNIPYELEHYKDVLKYPEWVPKEKRLVITGTNEGGYNCTQVDLLQLLSWVKKNHPELWEEV